MDSPTSLLSTRVSSSSALAAMSIFIQLLSQSDSHTPGRFCSTHILTQGRATHLLAEYVVLVGLSIQTEPGCFDGPAPFLSVSKSRYYNPLWLSGLGANENTVLHAARADQSNSVIKFWPKLRRSCTSAIVRDGAKNGLRRSFQHWHGGIFTTLELMW